MNLKQLLFWRLAVPSEPREYTAVGNPATFRTILEEPLKLTIPFYPVQAAGTPSPDNVLPITGFDGVQINVSATQTGGTEYQVEFTEAGTVYGGTLTVNKDGTGELVVDRGYTELTSVTQLSGFSTYQDFGAYASLMLQGIKRADNEIVLISSNAIGISRNNRVADEYKNSFRVHGSNSANKGTIWADGSLPITTVEELFAYYENAQFCYLLATPVSYSLTTDIVKSIVGKNYVWTDTNGENTIKYMR